jgi:hypothetical protein
VARQYILIGCTWQSKALTSWPGNEEEEELRKRKRLGLTIPLNDLRPPTRPHFLKAPPPPVALSWGLSI